MTRSPPPRLTPELALPPYSYVTGRFPHPTRDPAGHSFGHAPQLPAPISPKQWADSRTYLFGCDLFNHGYYWEAHETWEGLWQAEGRRGTTADLLKGLIKLAAAGVKAREGRPAGAQRHAARALELFAAVQARCTTPCYLGLELATLVAAADRCRQQPPATHQPLAAAEVVFDFCLLPA